MLSFGFHYVCEDVIDSGEVYLAFVLQPRQDTLIEAKAYGNFRRPDFPQTDHFGQLFGGNLGLSSKLICESSPTR